MEKFLQAWQRIRQHLRLKYGATHFGYWLENLHPVYADAERVTLTCASRFELDRILERYADVIERLVAEEAPGYGRVEFTVISQTRPVSTGNTALALRDEPEIVASPAVPGSIPLNRLCTFESFILGQSNEVAAAQARQIAENNAVPAGPLVLFGPTGLGKSHLVHALAQRFLERNPTKRVLFVTAEWFLGKFVAAVRGGDILSFKSLVREVDLLAIDDLHVACGKERTLEELQHTLDAVMDAGKLVVITADRSPALLEGLSDRFRSRLLNGVSVEIKPSDFDLRLAILECKAARITAENPRVVIGGEALRFIAQRINANTRELEGALHRVVSHADNGAHPLTIANLQLWLADFLKVHDRRVTVEEIKTKVAAFYGCKAADLESERRTREIVFPRQVAMFLSRQMTSRSLPDIAHRFKKKDHTTVIHAVRQIEKRRDSDPEFAQTLETLRMSIRTWPSQNQPPHH